LLAVEHAARAADALHEAGLAHGDIKPGNVMVHDSGGKLSDLGLARTLSAGVNLTSMAPETSIEFLDPRLLHGDPPSRSTDIWAIGATLHRALSGTGLYGDLPAGQPLLSIRKLQSTAPVVNPSLTASEAELTHACLDSIDRRPTTALKIAERIAALHMIEPRADRPRPITLAADKAYDAEDFVNELRSMNATPHVAQNTSGRSSAIDGRTTRHSGYEMSQRIRKRIEEAFGWMKTVAGQERTKFRGRERVGWAFTFAAAAYNLVRLPKLLEASA